MDLEKLTQLKEQKEQQEPKPMELIAEQEEKSNNDFSKVDIKDIAAAFVIFQSNVQAINNTLATRFAEVEKKLAEIQASQEKADKSIQAVPVQAETLLMNNVKDIFKEIDENKDIVTKAMRSETELFNSVLKNHQNKMNEKLKSWDKEIAEVIRLLIKTENRSSALIWINTVMAGVIVVFSIWIKIRG